MRFYLPLPDFFAFGTKKWSIFDFHEIFRKCLSPNYLATCKFSRPPMPGLYLNIVFENPAFRIACACALLHSQSKVMLKKWNIRRYLLRCWVIVALINTQQQADFVIVCYVSSLTCFGADNRRFLPQNVRSFDGHLFVDVMMWEIIFIHAKLPSNLFVYSSVLWVLMTKNLHYSCS